MENYQERSLNVKNHHTKKKVIFVKPKLERNIKDIQHTTINNNFNNFEFNLYKKRKDKEIPMRKDEETLKTQSRLIEEEKPIKENNSSEDDSEKQIDERYKKIILHRDELLLINIFDVFPRREMKLEELKTKEALDSAISFEEKEVEPFNKRVKYKPTIMPIEDKKLEDESEEEEEVSEDSSKKSCSSIMSNIKGSGGSILSGKSSQINLRGSQGIGFSHAEFQGNNIHSSKLSPTANNVPKSLKKKNILSNFDQINESR